MTLAGDSVPARYLANWILMLPILFDLPETYQSTKHRTNINTHTCGQFLTQNNTPESHQSRQYFLLHRAEVAHIVEGRKLWDGEGDGSIRTFGTFVCNSWFIIGVNTQLVEHWVKESNKCTLSEKYNHFSSIVTVYRSTTVFNYTLDSKVEAETRVLKGN